MRTNVINQENAKVYHISGTGLAREEQMSSKVKGQERYRVRCKFVLDLVSRGQCPLWEF